MTRRLIVALVLLALLAAPVAAQTTPSDGTGGARVPAQTTPEDITGRALLAACRVRAALPDPSCTPGAVVTTDRTVVCTSGYARSVRSVPDAEKRAVYAEYGITDPAGYVIDHLISLEIGGANDITNLWPEPAQGAWPGSHEKDLIEGALARAVCAGTVSITDAQRWLATDWRLALAEPAT